MRYLMTTHRWFQSSEGFYVKEVDADSLEHAEMIAAKHERDIYTNFRKARCDVIEIGENEHLAPRKLTLKERIIGKLSYGPPA